MTEQALGAARSGGPEPEPGVPGGRTGARAGEQGLGVADDVVRRPAVAGAAVPLGPGVVGDRGEVGLVDDPPRERGPAGEGERHPAPVGQQGDVGLAGAADRPDLGRQVARAGREDRQESGEAALDRLDVDDLGPARSPSARPSPGRVVDLDGEDGAPGRPGRARGSSGPGASSWWWRSSCSSEPVATAVVGPARPTSSGEEQAGEQQRPPSPRHLAASGRGAGWPICGHGNRRSVGSDTVREPRSSGWVDPVDHPASRRGRPTWLWGRSPLAAPQPSGRR